jgi:hypothetical protein
MDDGMSVNSNESPKGYISFGGDQNEDQKDANVDQVLFSKATQEILHPEFSSLCQSEYCSPKQ